MLSAGGFRRKPSFAIYPRNCAAECEAALARAGQPIVDLSVSNESSALPKRGFLGGRMPVSEAKASRPHDAELNTIPKLLLRNAEKFCPSPGLSGKGSRNLADLELARNAATKCGISRWGCQIAWASRKATLSRSSATTGRAYTRPSRQHSPSVQSRFQSIRTRSQTR